MVNTDRGHSIKDFAEADHKYHMDTFAKMADLRMSAMAITNQEYLARLLDTAGAPLLRQATDETKQALSSANAALQAGQATLELSKDTAPVLHEMKAVVAKLELIEQRLQVVEYNTGNKANGGCCTIS